MIHSVVEAVDDCREQLSDDIPHLVLLESPGSDDVREKVPAAGVLQGHGPGLGATTVGVVQESLYVRVGQFEEVVDLYRDQFVSRGRYRKGRSVGDRLQ